jgi:hypothetical protein
MGLNSIFTFHPLPPPPRPIMQLVLFARCCSRASPEAPAPALCLWGLAIDCSVVFSGFARGTCACALLVGARY